MSVVADMTSCLPANIFNGRGAAHGGIHGRHECLWCG